MTDMEISRDLAIAVGWKSVMRFSWGVMVKTAAHGNWRSFDYKDWNVIGPIAERYAAFPHMIADGNYRKHKKQGFAHATGWEVFITDYRKGTEQNAKWNHYVADTPQKAIALSVIGANV